MADSLNPVRGIAWGRLAAVLAAVLGVFFLALVAVQSARYKAQRSATLPDGTHIQFLGSAVGTNIFTTELPWQQFARKMLPAPFRRWLPSATSGSCSGGNSSVTFYFRATSPGSGAPTSTPWQRYSAADDNGFQYPAEGGSCSFGGGSAGTVYGLSLRSYPRRQSTFQFLFLDAQSKVLASMRLANPIRGPFPAWKPERLPITRTNGPLIVTLESLTDKTARGWRYFQPTWRLETADLRWRDAKPSYFEFEDATGNVGSYSSFQEPAWKLKLPFRREKPESFDAEEKFSITNLPSPAPGSLQSLDTAAIRVGVQVKVLCLAGAGALSIVNGTTRVMAPPVPGQSSGWSSGSTGGGTTTETWNSDKPFFLVEVQGAGSQDEIRFYLTPETGKPLRLESGGYQGGLGGVRRYQQRFDPLTNSASISLEIIVSRALEFEFVFDPAEIRRNASSSK